MPLVLDASVVLAWSFRDERHAYAHGVLRRLERDAAMVPSVWLLEVANGLLVAERRGRVTREEVREVYGTLVDLPIELRDVPFDRAFGAVLEIARSRSLSAYDASYLELAMREGVALATLDDELRAAARANGVTLVE